MNIDQFLQKNQLTLIKSFPVLWEGWECDSEWYLTQNSNGDKILVVSDHSSLRIGQAYELEDKLEHYREVIEKTEEIMKELETK